jgi:hypothetical protein
VLREAEADGAREQRREEDGFQADLVGDDACAMMGSFDANVCVRRSVERGCGRY